MPFIVIQIAEKAKQLKPWYGVSVPPGATISDIYSQFATGELDKGESLDTKYDGCKVEAMIGSSTNDQPIHLNQSLSISDAVGAEIYVTFYVNPSDKIVSEDTAGTSGSKPLKSAIQILMSSAASKTKHVPKKVVIKNAFTQLQNDVIIWLEDNNLGWSLQSVSDLGKEFVTIVSDVLWYIDGHHETLSTRGHTVPAMFAKFKGYNMPQNHKHRKRGNTNLRSTSLMEKSSTLFRLCGSTYLKSAIWLSVKENLLKLAENLRLHSTYLTRQISATTAQHSSKVQRTDEFEWEVYNSTQIVSTQTAQFAALHDALLKSPVYTPLFLNDFAPLDPRRRFEFMRCLLFPCKTVRFSYTSCREHLHFAWKVRDDDSESTLLQKNDEISGSLKLDFPKYFSRQMKRTFIDTFGRVTSVKPALLRSMFKTLTGDASSASNTHESEIDERLKQVIDEEDETLVWDLRVNNGRPETFLPFLERCQQYLNNCIETAVSDRRHDDVVDGEVVTHMATALSAIDFYDQVVKSCPEDIVIPSVQWLRWHFWPRRTGNAVSRRYTGRLKVKYMIMARQMREEHIDQYYASAIFRYQKEFSVEFRDYTSFVCQDDKHTIKVGEPGLPVAAVDRGKQVLVAKGQLCQVADHDFTKFSLSPSVSFKVDIPENMMGNFYSGTVFVGIKENAFEASSCIRHLTEYAANTHPDKPIECHYHDGGPDHNVRHMRNKLASIAYFLHRNLDLYCSVQTPPKHSWKNPAERCMSLLNIGLQGVGIMRQATVTCESKLKSAGNLGAIRTLEDSMPQIRHEVKDAIQPVKDLLNDVFSRLKLKGEPLKTFQAASPDDLSELAENLNRIDPNFNVTVLSNSKKPVKQTGPLKDFMNQHCLERHYMFSVKRCGNNDCVCGRPRLPGDVFSKLHHLPDPAPSPTEGDKFMHFQELYGKPHTEAELFLPSKTHNGAKKHGMPFCPSSQYAKNTKAVIQCEECQRWRCLYSKKVLKRTERDELHREMDTLSYSCGASFKEVDSSDDSVLKRVFTNERLTCFSPIEIPFYSSFPEEPLCFFCGSEDDLYNYDATKQYPLCTSCHAAGRMFQDKRTRNVNPRLN